jgi:hypothetical protein
MSMRRVLYAGSALASQRLAVAPKGVVVGVGACHLQQRFGGAKRSGLPENAYAFLDEQERQWEEQDMLRRSGGRKDKTIRQFLMYIVLPLFFVTGWWKEK